MADVLVVLQSLLERVSAMMMPTELNDVLQFLRGNHWHRVHRQGGAASATTKEERLLYVPDGRIAHHCFIPLAIATGTLLTQASGGDRATLQNLFSRHGFTRIVSVDLSPSSGGVRGEAPDGEGVFATQGLSGAATTAARIGTQAARGGRRRGRAQRDVAEAWCTVDAENTTAGRLASVECVRAWFDGVEEDARTRAASDSAQGADSPLAGATAPVRTDTTPDTVHALVLVVRCTADNRELVVSAASPSSSMKPADLVGAARRRSQQADPLFLLLHDLAALQTLYQVRLARYRGTQAHVAVLLLPDDHVYGGVLLQQRLAREVAYRFVVRRFQEEDAADVTTYKAVPGDAAGAVRALSPRWARARRLLDLWVPGWTAQLVEHAGTDSLASTTDTTTTAAARSPITEGALEAFLLRRRDDGSFFLRPGNLPLCAFLREALARFPVLLRAPHLQLLQAAWTSRHALIDVLWAFHALLMPFAVASPRARDSSTATRPSTPASQAAHALPESRQRRDYSDIYADTTTLLDALLDVATTMAATTVHTSADSGGAAVKAPPSGVASTALDEAVAFMLLIDEVSRQQTGLHVLRAAPIADALSAIFTREVRAAAAAGAEATPDRGESVKALLALSTDEQARHALLYLLPFHDPSPLCGGDGARASPRQPVRLPAVMRVSAMRLSVAGALQAAAVSAVLPPEESLKELVEVAGELRAHVSATNFYSPLVPEALRVMYMLATHAVYATTERERHVPLVQVQQACQLSDESLLQTLHELQSVGFIAVNAQRQTARCVLGS